MTTAAVMTMIAILTFVWGGFAVAVGLGLSRENRKRRVKERSGTSPTTD